MGLLCTARAALCGPYHDAGGVEETQRRPKGDLAGAGIEETQRRPKGDLAGATPAVSLSVTPVLAKQGQARENI